MKEKIMITDVTEGKSELPRRELIKEEKEFLLKNEEVLNRIVEGLIKDLKNL